MKFSTTTLLLATAFVAITCAACIGWWKLVYHDLREGNPLLVSLLSLTVFAPIWLPIAFLAYAIGRRRLFVWLVVVFAIVQGVAWFAAGVALELLRRR
jgi:hypothetical protein